MDGIRSSLGGCLLAGSRACEFCHGERCRRWSPGAAPVAGVRGSWPDWERKERGAGISLRVEARPRRLPGQSPNAGKRESCSPTLGFCVLGDASSPTFVGREPEKSCECPGRARLPARDEAAAASSHSSTRDSVALEFPHSRRPVWVGYVGEWVSVAIPHYCGPLWDCRRVLCPPHPPPESQSQEVIDCLWRLSVQGSAQKHVQRMPSESLGALPWERLRAVCVCLNAFLGLCQRKLRLRNPSVLLGAREWEPGDWRTQGTDRLGRRVAVQRVV